MSPADKNSGRCRHGAGISGFTSSSGTPVLWGINAHNGDILSRPGVKCARGKPVFVKQNETGFPGSVCY